MVIVTIEIKNPSHFSMNNAWSLRRIEQKKSQSDHPFPLSASVVPFENKNSSPPKRLFDAMPK